MLLASLSSPVAGEELVALHADFSVAKLKFLLSIVNGSLVCEHVNSMRHTYHSKIEGHTYHSKIEGLSYPLIGYDNKRDYLLAFRWI